MSDRLSTKQRIKLQNIAEKEVHRYKGDHALWHKHVHDIELDTMQLLKCVMMDENPNTIDFSCRRTGKTLVKELYLLYFLAVHSDQELGIVAPKEGQSLTNLNYHLEAIRRSPILINFIGMRSNRRAIADGYYQFANRSRARAYGIMSNVDGGDLTAASLEEVDDMPRERLFSRFLLMLGSTRRAGAAKDSINKPQIRVTGVFKGADTLSELIASKQYKLLPKVDAYLGIELGILNREYIEQMRDQLPPDEYIRQLLCENISARNLIWESYVRKAIQTGLVSKLDFVQPMPFQSYKKRGLISFGYDHTGHGEKDTSSKSALVVTEQLGNYTCFIFAKTWAAGTDERLIKDDLYRFWQYFKPDCAIGDAFGIGMLTQLNDDLYVAGLTDIDRMAVGQGQSSASTWQDWAFAPLRFEGMTKHAMAQAIRSLFHNKQAVIPYFDDSDMVAEDTMDMRTLVRQLTNIVSVPTKVSYASYKMANPKLGDDLFDGAMASVWGLVTRGAAPIETVILSSQQSRARLLYQ